MKSFKIKDKRIPFSIILVLLPIFAFASGDDVLSSFYVIGASIIFFLVVLIAIKLNPSGKSVLVIVYFVTLFLMLYLTSDIPYRNNRNIINSCLGLVPIGACLITFWILRVNNKKTT